MCYMYYKGVMIAFIDSIATYMSVGSQTDQNAIVLFKKNKQAINSLFKLIAYSSQLRFQFYWIVKYWRISKIIGKYVNLCEYKYNMFSIACISVIEGGNPIIQMNKMVASSFLAKKYSIETKCQTWMRHQKNEMLTKKAHL